MVIPMPARIEKRIQKEGRQAQSAGLPIAMISNPGETKRRPTLEIPSHYNTIAHRCGTRTRGQNDGHKKERHRVF